MRIREYSLWFTIHKIHQTFDLMQDNKYSSFVYIVCFFSLFLTFNNLILNIQTFFFSYEYLSFRNQTELLL